MIRMIKMPYEPRDGGPPESGWIAVCLTLLGGVLGPMASLGLILRLPYEWCVVGLYFFFSMPIAGGFFLGVLGGHWLGTKLERFICGRKSDTNALE
jgi:hypothetical protein